MSRERRIRVRGSRTRGRDVARWGSLLAAMGGLCLALAATSSTVAAQPTGVTIATASPGGNYFLSGNAVCRALQRQGHRIDNGDVKPIQCLAMPSGGSIDNIGLLRTRSVDAALVQSDWLYRAVHGSDRFEGRPATRLRTLLQLYGEAFQIVSARGTRIELWPDLKAKKVNVGPSGATAHSMFKEILAAHGQTETWFTQALRLTTDAQVQELCEGNIEAFGQPSGVPNAGIRNALARCGAQLVALDTPEVRRLITERPYYKLMSIPANSYPGQRADIVTLSVSAALVVTADMPETLAYAITKTVIESLSDIQAAVPVMRSLTPAALADPALSAPLHPGAERALRELGLFVNVAPQPAPAASPPTVGAIGLPPTTPGRAPAVPTPATAPPRTATPQAPSRNRARPTAPGG